MNVNVPVGYTSVFESLYVAYTNVCTNVWEHMYMPIHMYISMATHSYVLLTLMFAPGLGAPGLLVRLSV